MNREKIIEASQCSACEMNCIDCRSDTTNRAEAVDGYCSSVSVKCPFELGAEWMQEQKQAEIDAIKAQVNEDTYELAYQDAIDKCWNFLAEQCVGDNTFVFTENNFIKAMKGK